MRLLGATGAQAAGVTSNRIGSSAWLGSFFTLLSATATKQPDGNQRKRYREQNAEHAGERRPLTASTRPEKPEILHAVGEVAIHCNARNKPSQGVACGNNREVKRERANS